MLDLHAIFDVDEEAPARRSELPGSAEGPKADSAEADGLKRCRCAGCSHWDDVRGLCYLCGLRRYVPRWDYHPKMRRFWTDVGMVRPGWWQWCRYYESN